MNELSSERPMRRVAERVSDRTLLQMGLLTGSITSEQLRGRILRIRRQHEETIVRFGDDPTHPSVTRVVRE